MYIIYNYIIVYSYHGTKYATDTPAPPAILRGYISSGS